jgi:hypothetical protein
MFAEIYGWSPQGFDTTDLRNVGVPNDELSQ